MKFDITKLPIAEAVIGFLLAATVGTFVLAAWVIPPGSGAKSEEAVEELSPTPEATPQETPEPGDGDGDGEGTVVEIAMVPVIAFDVTDISVPAGQPVTLTADNIEPGVPHNWALYQSREIAESEGPSAALATTALCTDCTETITFDPPPPGTYFFRCDVHPIQMVGTFTVE